MSICTNNKTYIFEKATFLNIDMDVIVYGGNPDFAKANEGEVLGNLNPSMENSSMSLTPACRWREEETPSSWT